MPTVTPGKIFSNGELVTTAKLNQLGNPIVELNDEDVAEVVDSVRQTIPTINRNVLINGNFDVWQRGGYLNLLGVPNTLGDASGDASYGPDRWYIGTASGASKRQIYRQGFTVGQTSVPNEPAYFLRWDQLVAQTGDHRPKLQQKIEDVRTFAGKDVVVTWWMKGTYSGDVTCSLLQYFGTLVGPPAYPAVSTSATTGGTATLASGEDWEQYTATFTVPTLIGKGIEGPDHHLALVFSLPDNTTFQIDFAQIQMEEGTVATPFEVLPYLKIYEQCLRYFEYSGGVAGTSVAAIMPCYYFGTRKFTAPTLELISGYAGTMTAANFSTILDIGFFQDTANSVVSAFFMACDAEIY